MVTRQSPPPATARRLASIPDAAQYAAVSPKTIRRWIAAGRLDGYRAGPRLIRVDLNQLDATLTPVVGPR